MNNSSSNLSYEQLIEFNKKLNAFIHLIKETKHKDNPYGEINGLTLSIKDNICTAGVPTTAGSKILSNFIPVKNAYIIDKLEKEGGIIIGKTNMDEFGMGSTGESSAFGPTKYFRRFDHYDSEDNISFTPKSEERSPGGSSSGAAVSVQAGLVDIAIGSDTGGSIRQPASYTGLYGFKPTYGLISRNGLISYASSLDQIGILASNMDHLFRAFISMANIWDIDPEDSTSVKFPEIEWDKPVSRNMKIAYPKQFNPKYNKGISSEVAEAITKEIDFLSSLYVIEEVDLPILEYAIPVYYIIAMAEASSNLSRYDGVRYGVRAESKELSKMYSETRSANFGPEVIKRIAMGTYVLSAGYHDAYYKKAIQMRDMMTATVNKLVFNNGFDLIIGPTTPTVAPKLGEIQDSLSMYMGDIFTVPANLMGLPSGSIPIRSSGYPIGLQVMGRRFGDKQVMLFMKGE